MFSDFSVWWEGLPLIEQIFWTIAVPFSLFFVLQLVLTFFAGDLPTDMDADAEIESDHGIGFQFFTLKNLVAFFTIFSWTGIACLDSGVSQGWAITIAVFAGLAMMALMTAILYFMSKAVESGTLEMKNAIGGVGEVYLEVKAKRENIGKVQIKVQGSLRTLEAITDDESDLKQGAVISVIRVINDNILLVTKSV